MPEGVQIPGISALQDLFDAFFPEVGTPVKFGTAVQFLRSIQQGKLDENIRILEEEMTKVIKLSSAYEFGVRWMWMRNWLPLQLRLLMEQVFWRMGKPYTYLITGFGPIEVRKLMSLRDKAEERRREGVSGPKGGAGGKKQHKRRPPRPKDYYRYSRDKTTRGRRRR